MDDAFSPFPVPFPFPFPSVTAPHRPVSRMRTVYDGWLPFVTFRGGAFRAMLQLQTPLSSIHSGQVTQSPVPLPLSPLTRCHPPTHTSNPNSHRYM